ncbi:MAG: hypothetical protein IPI97_15135 [Nitrosomonas sp.]|nr:hypothetical protein [Nitrosomonas sp.]
MAHIRKQLRDRAKQVIEQAIQRPVFVNRTKQISPNDLPCVVITTDTDQAQYQALGNYSRDIALNLRVFEKALFNVDDLLDEHSVKIENALSENNLGADELQLNSTTLDFFGEGDQPIAVATLQYVARILDVTDPEKVIY